MKKVSRLLTALVLAVVSLCGTALAQTAASGNIEGVVTDATGAVLPGVTVVVKNTATNISRDLVTDEAGRYRANALQPGVYEIAATLGGFQSTNVGNLEVLVGQTLAVDMIPYAVSNATWARYRTSEGPSAPSGASRISFGFSPAPEILSMASVRRLRS